MRFQGRSAANFANIKDVSNINIISLTRIIGMNSNPLNDPIDGSGDAGTIGAITQF